MDFFQIKERSTKRGVLEIYPDFRVCRSKDLMIRGKGFYAIWDYEKKIWSTDEYDVQKLVDKKLMEYRETVKGRTDDQIYVKLMSDFSSGSWQEFRKYMVNLSDNSHQLDEELTFANTPSKKTDYISKRLPYPLEAGTYEAYDEIIGTLYDPEERAKLEWAIGAVVAGDAKDIQKFIVLYGDAGAGKSTILNIIQSLFDGYYTTFEAKALTSSSNAFATEAFKGNPLVAIQHDGDLSRIEDNSKLNSIISHEEMTMNEKYKPSYMARINSFLFMATNKPVKITDAKSGIIRRPIDVKPSGRKLPTNHYFALMQQIDFELGAIAQYCLETYREMGKNYYNSYKPLEMIFTTDIFFNFVEAHYHIFKEQDGVTLIQAYQMYKTYCDDSLIEFKLARHKFREELKNYFQDFAAMTRVDGTQTRNYYSGFLTEKFTNIMDEEDEVPNRLVLDSTESLLDDICSECPAQYATSSGVPMSKWDSVKTELQDMDTSKVHYVKVPLNHIVIDFDITDETGEKSLEKNLEAASKWPPTYAEFSKSEKGIHLHYIYDGDPETLSRIYEENIEIKVFVGNSSLRRKLSKCNTIPITTINSGLPLKGAKMINFEAVKSEKSLRNLINRNIEKEIHPGTKPSIDFIHKILSDAYGSDLKYDLTDMRPRILAFANNSSNQAEYCVRLVSQMKFKSEDGSEAIEDYDCEEIAFFDVEVYPNLLLVVWKMRGEGKTPVVMVNPTALEVEEIFKLKLTGFNCRRYDNHILYARYMGYNNKQIYDLSQKIISNSRNGLFREAYNISYTDIYDFSAKKQSLKKFQIELGLNHKEMSLSWDEPVPEEKWPQVIEYCINDVITTEQVFEARYQDFVARQILADLSGLTVNDTTQRLAAKIIFGNDHRPQDKFEYTDLGEMFPGYTFDFGKSEYRGEDPKEGGYVYAEPGMYGNVALLDVESMHPSSAILLNAFGPYTARYEEMKEARLAIKHGEIEKAKVALGGVLAKYLVNTDDIKDLDTALKIVINIVYGLSSAKFDNKFKDPRNVDNIIAKRGALFMIDLKHAVQEQGFTVAHIKTDSIKIPDATPEIIDFVIKFGKEYGYVFEHECTFDKFCLVNDAVYIAKVRDREGGGEWDATGTQFADPIVYKTLFTKEPIVFDDKVESKSVTTALYLDMNEHLEEGEHNYHFIGKAGAFCPIKPGRGGGLLMREKDGKYNAASGTKGFRWLESELVRELDKEDDIDMTLFTDRVDKAIDTINKFGDFEWFVSEDAYDKNNNDILPV